MSYQERINKKGDKKFFYFDLGRAKGQRVASGIFVYTKPKNQVEKNHNKEALQLLELKHSQLTLEKQAIGSGYIPSHKYKPNFLDYFEEYVRLNQRAGNRHLQNCLSHLKAFIKKDFVSPVDITENFCKRFRQYLLDRFTGETPANYYARFKWVLRAATKDGYFRTNPTEAISAKSNASVRLKEVLEVDDYLRLLKTPCLNEEVKEGFLFSCYTGLRWVDTKNLRWEQINQRGLTTRILQKKTGVPVTLTLHPVAKAILDKRREIHHQRVQINERVFALPSADGANKALEQWLNATGINKHITWSCARLSFSVLLQDSLVDEATVAYLMGHTTTEQVRKTYKRHRPKDQMASISHLPKPEGPLYFGP